MTPTQAPGGPPPSTPEAPAARSARAREALTVLGRRIRALRERSGLTQEEFAHRAGISVSFASLLERGERSPSYETLLELAGALDVPISELFRETPGDERDEPWFARLTDFARSARLPHAQVDRLIRVGQVMFEDGELPGQRDGAVCGEERCDRPVLARGLCASHYHRARRAGRAE